MLWLSDFHHKSSTRYNLNAELFQNKLSGNPGFNPIRYCQFVLVLIPDQRKSALTNRSKRAFSIWIEYLSSAVGLGTNVERGLIFMSRHHTTSKSIRCNVCNVVPRQINQSSHANYWQGSLERIWHSSLPPSLEEMPFVKNNYKHTKIWLFFSSVSATWNPRLVCLECVSLETDNNFVVTRHL